MKKNKIFFFSIYLTIFLNFSIRSCEYCTIYRTVIQEADVVAAGKVLKVEDTPAFEVENGEQISLDTAIIEIQKLYKGEINRHTVTIVFIGKSITQTRLKPGATGIWLLAQYKNATYFSAYNHPIRFPTQYKLALQSKKEFIAPIWKIYLKRAAAKYIKSIRNLADDQDFIVRVHLALNPNIPEDILLKLAQDKSSIVRYVLVHQRDFIPTQILKLLEHDEFEHIRYIAHTKLTGRWK